MMQVTVHEGQTILDIALQSVGDLSRVFEISKLNNLNPTDDLVVGSLLFVPFPAKNKMHISDLFQGYERPQSGITDFNLAEGRSGIGFSAIDIDFIIQ